VSIRTLHFYDQIGLLKPAFVGANGYRYYQDEQLLVLQQILFYRELEFELKEIQRILARRNFDKLGALKKHRVALLQKQERVHQLIQTIDQTIKTLSGGRKMKAKEMFGGFDPKKQAKHEEYLIQRYGEGAREGIEKSKQKVKHWNKDNWQKSGEEWDAICKHLVQNLQAKLPADSSEVQSVIARHYQWLKQFWTPTKDSYAGHGTFIADSELGKAYEKYHPDLPSYIASGIKVFAERRLS
jgi:MerR family transcriptional regulator, thiopeptide resistance regulator